MEEPLAAMQQQIDAVVAKAAEEKADMEEQLRIAVTDGQGEWEKNCRLQDELDAALADVESVKREKADIQSQLDAAVANGKTNAYAAAKRITLLTRQLDLKNAASAANTSTVAPTAAPGAASAAVTVSNPSALFASVVPTAREGLAKAAALNASSTRRTKKRKPNTPAAATAAVTAAATAAAAAAASGGGNDNTDPFAKADGTAFADDDSGEEEACVEHLLGSEDEPSGPISGKRKRGRPKMCSNERCRSGKGKGPGEAVHNCASGCGRSYCSKCETNGLLDHQNDCEHCACNYYF